MTHNNFNLIPFRDTNLPVNVSSEIRMVNSNLEVEFLISGDIQSLLLAPKAQISRRVIGLWESTCFELFILNNQTLSYYEFNFSSEGHWNSFYFPKKKSPLKQADSFQDIKIDVNLTIDIFRIKATLDLYSFMPNFWKEESMSFGLTTILESEGNLSYWALSHQDDEPNFHNFKTFEKIEL